MIAAPVDYPVMTPDICNTPLELIGRRQWVCWSWKPKDDKSGESTKIPYNPDRPANRAHADKPATWSTFSQAIRYAELGCDGPGFELGRDGPYFVIDIDGCLNQATGEIAPWAAPWIEQASQIGAYIQKSNSGSGLHIWVKAVKPWADDRHKTQVLQQPGSKAHVDLFAGNQFLCMTGHLWCPFDGPIPDGQELVDAIWADATTKREPIKLFPRSTSTASDKDEPINDDELIERARQMGNGDKFARLYDHNDWKGLPYTSQSDADFALLVMLAWLTWNDADRMDQLFRASKMIEAPTTAGRWARRAAKEIENAIAYNGNRGYDPSTGVTHALPTAERKAELPTPEPTDWPAVQPLPTQSPVPMMSADFLPDAVAAWIADIADIARLPIEMIAAPAVCALGSIIGKAIGVRPWQFSNFTTVPNLWGIVIAPPGWMKSFAVSEALSPVGRLAAIARESYELALENAEVEIADIESQIKAAKKRLDKANDAGDKAARDEIKDLLRELNEQKKTAVPVERRYMTHDATVEKLADMLMQNSGKRGLLVVRDEIIGLLQGWDKSGRENDRQFYLEGWNGTDSFNIDRIGRGSNHIDTMTLSIVGSTQPGRIRSLIEGSAAGGALDDGLVQRFQITVWPDTLQPWQKPDRWPNAEAKERAFNVFQSLATVRPSDVSAQAGEHDKIPYLQFTSIAQGQADTWHDALEHRLRSGELDESPAFASHVAKYRSLMPSLALIFHLADVADGQKRPGPITEHSVQRAIRWCDYLEAHARKVYDVELNRGLAAARLLAQKITAGAIVDMQPIREIYRNGWSGLKTDETVLAGFEVLALLGWIRTESVATGGRASQIIRLNPALMTEAAE